MKRAASVSVGGDDEDIQEQSLLMCYQQLTLHQCADKRPAAGTIGQLRPLSMTATENRWQLCLNVLTYGNVSVALSLLQGFHTVRT